MWSFRARIACLKVFIFLRTHYTYEISWTISDLKLDYLDWKNQSIREPIPSVKLPKNFQPFKAPKACLKIYTFLQTDSVYEVTWNSLKFQSSNSMLNNSNLRTNSVYEIIWNNSKLRSSNSVLNNSTFLKTNSLQELTRKKKSMFQSSNIALKEFLLFSNQLRLWKNF